VGFQLNDLIRATAKLSEVSNSTGTTVRQKMSFISVKSCN